MNAERLEKRAVLERLRQHGIPKHEARWVLGFLVLQLHAFRRAGEDQLANIRQHTHAVGMVIQTDDAREFLVGAILDTHPDQYFIQAMNGGP